MPLAPLVLHRGIAVKTQAANQARPLHSCSGIWQPVHEHSSQDTIQAAYQQNRYQLSRDGFRGGLFLQRDGRFLQDFSPNRVH